LLRTDPAFELARGWLPETGADLCSQPTLSRLDVIVEIDDTAMSRCLPAFRTAMARVTCCGACADVFLS